MALLKPYPISTYQTCYKGERPLLPPIKYHQVPSLVHRGSSQQPPRQFPIDPEGPIRHLERNQLGPVLKNNINTDKFSEPKPIVKTAEPSKIRTHPKSHKRPKTPPSKSDGLRCCEKKSAGKERVFDTKFGKMNTSEVNALVNKVRWTSTTTSAAEEACLPVTKVKPPESVVERNADIVKLRGKIYEKEPGDWQKSVFWDCVQLRGMVTHNDLGEKTYGFPGKLLNKRKKMGEKGQADPECKIRQLIHKDKLSNIYVRQCPGYAGFVPREPTEGPIERKPEEAQMISTMKGTYKRLPLEEYQTHVHSRKAPFSKTVTLTYPFNPYNKIVARSKVI